MQLYSDIRSLLEGLICLNVFSSTTLEKTDAQIRQALRQELAWPRPPGQGKEQLYRLVGQSPKME